MATEMPVDQRLHGRLVLRESLGSEVNAHFEIAAPPVLTEDTKELAEDVGTAHQYEAHTRNESKTSKLVGRFNARTQVREGQPIEVVVDTRALHFFDIDTGLGIYDGAEAESSLQGEPSAVVGSPSKEDDDHEKAEVSIA